MSKTRRTLHLAVVLAFTLASAPRAAAAPASEPGVQWEQTTEMQMAGFSMPPQTSRVCVPKKGISEPPGADRKNENCKVTRMSNDGHKMSWAMECSGEEKMTGEGEIVHSGDSYEGKMVMHSGRGDMTMKLRGKKVGGECDAGEVKRTVAAVQGAAAAQTANACRNAVQSVQLSLFTGPGAMCKDPADRKALCDRAATREGVRMLSLQPASSKEIPALCGKDLATLLADACRRAGTEEAAAVSCDARGDTLGFIGQSCPAETRTIAQRECAGRTYTDLQGGCFRSFCTSYAADLLDKGKKPAPASPPPKSPDDAAQDAVKKAAKGLLPF
jgi:hypothetical protein